MIIPVKTCFSSVFSHADLRVQVHETFFGFPEDGNHCTKVQVAKDNVAGIERLVRNALRSIEVLVVDGPLLLSF
jgi:hypothetical protein